MTLLQIGLYLLLFIVVVLLFIAWTKARNTVSRMRNNVWHFREGVLDEFKRLTRVTATAAKMNTQLGNDRGGIRRYILYKENKVIGWVTLDLAQATYDKDEANLTEAFVEYQLEQDKKTGRQPIYLMVLLFEDLADNLANLNARLSR